jgi:hypothetical protein
MKLSWLVKTEKLGRRDTPYPKIIYEIISYLFGLIIKIIHRYLASITYLIRCEHVFKHYPKHYVTETISIEVIPVLGNNYLNILYHLSQIIIDDYISDNKKISYYRDSLIIAYYLPEKTVTMTIDTNALFFKKEIMFSISIMKKDMFADGYYWINKFDDVLSRENAYLIYDVFNDLIKLYKVDVTKLNHNSDFR